MKESEVKVLKVKELKQILEEECDDEDYVSLEYVGCEMELEHGNTFRDIDSQDIEFNKNNITIVFS